MFKLAPPPPPHLILGTRMAPPPPPHLMRASSAPQQRLLQTCDTECYVNYWLIKFYDPAKPSVVTWEFEMWPGHPLDVVGVRTELARSTIVTFNGINYDLPMITLALAGADCSALKKANDLIIVGKLKWWEFYKHFQLVRPDEPDANGYTLIDNIDVKEVAPGVNVSLKTYGGRMASRRLQDLPIKPSGVITPEQRGLLSLYCTNDLITTWELYQRCIKAINLRIDMTLKYGIDLRSKSDAQIAEALFKVKLGFKPEKAFWPHLTPFKYTAPAFIKFDTPELQAVLDLLHSLTFYTSDADQVDDPVDAAGNVIKTGISMPTELGKLRIKIGDSIYKLGKGGLHSTESARHHISDAFHKLSDHDVASYYPSLILICGMYPKQLGDRFLQIYRDVYDERLAAKALGAAIGEAIKQAKIDGVLTGIGELEETMLIAMAEADAKKIVLNGTFGKLGSKYSIFFSPDLLLQVTLTGQLCLLMLIETLEQSSIPVVSANTDGIVIKCPVGSEYLRDTLIGDWESRTGLVTEQNDYAALYSRDVNNYIAYKYSGEAKVKGAFAKAGVAKNPTNSVVVTAVIDYLGKGIPLESTIYACQDIREFLTIRNCKGGGVKVVHGHLPSHASREQLCMMAGYTEEFEGWVHNQNVGVFFKLKDAYAAACKTMRPVLSSDYLGKVVRWYHGVGEVGSITSDANGNKVADSDGAVPLMDLCDGIPANLDRGYYVESAKKMLATLGIVA